MTHHLQWELPNAVLILKLSGEMTLEEFAEINRRVTETLSSVDATSVVTLIIDVTFVRSVPQAFQRLGASQSYATSMNTPLKHILVVSGDNKLMRLMMLLIFNVCRPSLQFFKTSGQALTYLSNVYPSQPK